MTLPALLLALVLAGCGGEDARDARTATAPTAQTATTAIAPPTTGAQTAPQTERERVGECLKKDGYRLQGGAPQVDDTESPEYQIIFSGPRGGGYIGFYKNASRARRVAAQLRKNAQRTTGAAVERHGAINVVWVDLPDQGARRRVRACLTV
jgi:hypothetical protein